MATEDSDEIEIDELNKKIIEMVANSKKPLSISQAIKPFVGEKSDRALRLRVDRLSLLGYLHRKKYPGCALISATKRGQAMEAQK